MEDGAVGMSEGVRGKGLVGVYNRGLSTCTFWVVLYSTL